MMTNNQQPAGEKNWMNSADSRSKNSATNQNRAVFSYGGCTHLVWTVYVVTGTDLVWSWYGVGTEQLGVFFLGPPTPPQIHFKMILSSFPLRKKV